MLRELVDFDRFPELYSRTREPSDEGLTDDDFILQQIEWILEDYQESGHCLHDELMHARWLIKRTEDGKRIPISTETFRPLAGFTPEDIKRARAVIQEYNDYRTLLKVMRRACNRNQK